MLLLAVLVTIFGPSAFNKFGLDLDNNYNKLLFRPPCVRRFSELLFWQLPHSTAETQAGFSPCQLHPVA